MADTTYQYQFSDQLSNGTQSGTFSGSFTFDYDTFASSGSVTVITPNGTDIFPIMTQTVLGNRYQVGGTAQNGDTLVLLYTGMTPTSFTSGYYQPANPNLASYQIVQPSPITSTDTTVCFAAGTHIRTASGDVAVEALAIGDLAVTASGARRPIRWLGHRAIDCHRHPRPHEALPVRIAAGAFGEGRPAHDLFVSPGHAICVDAVGEILIPAAALVNGATIVQVQVDTVTYWHVELEGGHDIILAENLPCESYLDMGNRSFFAEAYATALHASPDARAVTHADFCRPFHQDGPLVSFVRERLAARATNLGWTLEQLPLANLHLLVDGKRVEPATSGLSARFLVPADAGEVWLMSNTSVPVEIGMGPDPRALGVCVGSLIVDDGFDAPHTIPADHPLLSEGFHDIEEGQQRWTCGRALVDRSFWNGFNGAFFLRVELTRPALPRWSSATVADYNRTVALAG